jgi:hypothetical protein
MREAEDRYLHGRFLELAASHRGRTRFALQHSPLRHCVRVIAESCDSLLQMDEFLVGVVYIKRGCNLVPHDCSRLLGLLGKGKVSMGRMSMGRMSMGRINGGRR